MPCPQSKEDAQAQSKNEIALVGLLDPNSYLTIVPHSNIKALFGYAHSSLACRKVAAADAMMKSRKTPSLR